MADLASARVWPCCVVLCAAVQVGVIEDQENRERLSKLLRFYSSKCEGDNLVGLQEYAGRMKEGQKGIYYMVRTLLGFRASGSLETPERNPPTQDQKLEANSNL